MDQPWTRKTLSTLSSELDRLLRQDLGSERMAIPLLHFRSAHPVALQAYEPLLSSDRIRVNPTAQIRRALGRLRDRLGSWEPVISGDTCPDQVDVLFISHLLNKAQALNSERDPYFGTLPQSLTTSGMRVAVAMIDHRSEKTSLASIWDSSVQAPRLLLSARLGVREEAQIAAKTRKAARNLLKGQSEYENIRRLAARQALSGATRQNLRIAKHVEYLVHRLQPKALVFTYEGHAWERLAMQAARRVHPSILCCAVHHSILAPMQHAMLRRYGLEYDPDYVFAAGEVAGDWLKSSHAFDDKTVSVLGSHRAQKQPLRDPRSRGTNPLTCLFLPEGFLEESALLARKAIALARQRRDVTCVVRLHPVLPRAKLVAAYPELGELPANVIWSGAENSLADDSARARWCVYRGSSAVLTAIAHGAEPIYLGEEVDELHIDPLRGRTGFGKAVNSLEEMLAAVQVERYDPHVQALSRQYAARYYTTLNPRILVDAINGVP